MSKMYATQKTLFWNWLGKKSAEYVGAQILIHDNTYSFYEYFPLNYGQSQ